MSKAIPGKPQHRETPWMRAYGITHFDLKPANARYRGPDLVIRDGKWKVLVNDEGSGTELYNVETDVAESVNLAKENPEIAKRLSQQVINWWEAMAK